MLESRAESGPFWEQEVPEDERLAEQLAHMREERLLLDPRPPVENNALVLSTMSKTTPIFWVAFLGLGGLVVMFLATWVVQIFGGLGITGLNRTVMWGPYIANLIYFIGIGHGGTFISAALRLLHMDFRRPLARAAEIMTLFALTVAALFPVIHVGRVWKIYYMFPIPEEHGLWPNFRSPLFWDVTAISAYLIGSTLFMYASLLPDLAMARDHLPGWRHKLYGVLALGWRGTEREWHGVETISNIISYIIIPVMISVSGGISWDMAMTIQPGWHSTIFGPYFIAGALFSAVAAVILVMIIVRTAFRLGYFFREEHFNAMGIFLFLMALAWIYFYFNDWITNWYGDLPPERAVQLMFTGPLAPLFYLMLFSGIVVPVGTLWSRRVRTSLPAMFVVCVFVQIAMFVERALIVEGMLARNELRFNWVNYTPHLPEILMTVGAFGVVAFMYLVFTRLAPIVPVWEVYEGQTLQKPQRIARTVVSTHTDVE
jgi:Ni/Fe-hydrogenase subunit HybB-like protein